MSSEKSFFYLQSEHIPSKVSKRRASPGRAHAVTPTTGIWLRALSFIWFYDWPMFFVGFYGVTF